MAAEERTIQLTLISAKDLKRARRSGIQQSCYAVAYIYSSQKKMSPVDNVGGLNPNWNSTLKFTCDESLLQYRSGNAITVEIFRQLGSGDGKLIGMVKIPLEIVVVNHGKVMSLPVIRKRRAVRGTLNLSVTLGEKRRLGDPKMPSSLQRNAVSPSLDEFLDNPSAQQVFPRPRNYDQGSSSMDKVLNNPSAAEQVYPALKNCDDDSGPANEFPSHPSAPQMYPLSKNYDHGSEFADPQLSKTKNDDHGSEAADPQLSKTKNYDHGSEAADPQLSKTKLLEAEPVVMGYPVVGYPATPAVRKAFDPLGRTHRDAVKSSCQRGGPRHRSGRRRRYPGGLLLLAGSLLHMVMV